MGPGAQEPWFRLSLLLSVVLALGSFAGLAGLDSQSAAVRTVLDRMRVLCGRSCPAPIPVEVLPLVEHQQRWQAVLARAGWARMGMDSERNLSYLGFAVPEPSSGSWWRWPRAPEAFWDASARTLILIRDPRDDPQVGEWVLVSALRAAWQDLAGWPRTLVTWPSHDGLRRDILQWGDRVLMLALYGGRYTVWPCTPEIWAEDEDRTAMLTLLPLGDWPRAREGMPLIRERLEWPFKAGITCLLPFARKREKWARWQDLWGGERGAWTGPAEKVLGAAGRSLELEGFEDERSVALKRDRMGPWWLEQWLGVPVISLGTWKGDAYLIRRRGTLLTACGEVLWKDAAAGWNGCSALERVWKERFGMIFRRGGLGGGVLAGQGSGRYGLLQVRGAVLRWVLTQDREEANQWMQRGTLVSGGRTMPAARVGGRP